MAVSNCYTGDIDDKRSDMRVGLLQSRLPIRIGQTTPLERLVKVLRDTYSDVTICQILIKKGFLYKSLTNRKPSEIKWIIDGLYAFGKNGGLNTPPLLYISNRYMYVILAQNQLFNGLQWTRLHIGKGTFIPDVFVAYRNEYHQYFCCTVSDFSSFAKRIGTGHIPFIKFDDLKKSELTEGFSDSFTNECHYPLSENLNKPAYDSSQLKFPIQASDDVENVYIETVEQNSMHQSGLEDVGLDNNLKWKTAKYPTYSAAEKRLATYRGLPLAEPSPHTLYIVGFFFTGNDYDLVRCFCCGIGLKDFSDSDDPLLEHAKHSSNCQFIVDYFGSREALEAYKQRFSAQDPEEIRRRQRELYERQQGRPITTYKAKHERFRTFESRFGTFTNWPQHLSQRPKELAKAGMYYTETLLKENQLLKGFLRCHSCHTNQVNCLFLPCTHHRYCLDCTQYSEKCPDCGRPIKERIRTYMA